MRNATQITITNIPEISAIYFALLQCGYSYYTIERSQKHNARIRSFIRAEGVPSFFSRIKQNTCQVYPYWPRAAILETASFYLLPDHSQFRDYDAFRSCIMNAGNIEDNDRNQKLWNWIDQFPAALSDVLSSDAFRRYLEWEEKWLAERNIQHEADLRLIKSCLDVCVSKYGSPVQDIQIVVNPVKCVYSSDYHLVGNRFIFCSGAFRVDSAIHEFLHHVAHPAVAQIANWVIANRNTYPGIDNSYYLSGDDVGQLNAFEEYAVRELTQNILLNQIPEDLTEHLLQLLQRMSK